MNRPDTAQYRSLEGSLFTLEPPERQWSLTLRLDAVKELGSRVTQAGATPCYSLSFSQQGTERGYAPQGLYRLRHDVLGEQELFVVPVGPSVTAPMRYEVIFN
jgi:hypothetical protein